MEEDKLQDDDVEKGEKHDVKDGDFEVDGERDDNVTEDEGEEADVVEHEVEPDKVVDGDVMGEENHAVENDDGDKKTL